MGPRFSSTDSEHSVEQQYALVGPRRQVAVGGGLDAEVIVKFLIDVSQAAWQRANLSLDRECESNGMAGCRVRVLPDDDDANRVERSLECAKHVVIVWQVFYSRAGLRVNSIRDVAEQFAVWFENRVPRRIDAPAERQSHR